MDGFEDLYSDYHRPTRRYALDPGLIKLAELELEKMAIVPAGGMPQDPAMGGGMPPDPSMGGGTPAPPPVDPAMAGGGAGGMDPNAIAQQVIQTLGAGGAGGGAGAGGMAGRPGGKKAEQAMTDAKLYRIDVKLTALMKHLQCPVPPEAALDAPPDPMAAQAASQDHAATSAAISGNPAATPGGDPAQAGGQGIAPVQAMDPSQGPPPPAGMKQGGLLGDAYPYESLDELAGSIGRGPARPSLAAQMRALLESN